MYYHILLLIPYYAFSSLFVSENIPLKNLESGTLYASYYSITIESFIY